MTGDINIFRCNFDFLSNFYNAPFYFNSIRFENAEAAFQAQKEPARTKEFEKLTGSEAKRLGRRVNLRSDWNAVRVNIMQQIVLEKFTQNNNLAERLMRTQDRKLIEGNAWNDTFWGVCNGRGQNKLGVILMTVRDNLNERRGLL